MVLLGPSGSGKVLTLIRYTINALESIDNGTLIVNGHNVTEASAKDLVELRKKLGWYSNTLTSTRIKPFLKM